MAEFSTALRNHDFRLLVVGRSVSWFGNAMAPMAITFAVLDLDGSVAAVSVAVLSRSVPQLVLVLVGGVLADRAHAKRWLVAGSGVAAVSQAVVAASVIGGSATLWLIVGLSALNGVSAALAGPSAGSLFRRIVARPAWRASSVLDRSGQQLGLVLGLSSGGVLIGWAGPGVAIAVDAATFVVAVGCYLAMASHRGGGEPHPSLITQLVEGFGFLRGQRWLVATTVQAVITSIAVAGGLQVLAAVVADRTFGRPGVGLAGSLQTGGAVIGLVLAGVVAAPRRLSVSIWLTAGFALPVGVLALGPLWWNHRTLLICYGGAMLMAGAAAGAAGVWRNLIVLERVDASMMGRVTSYGLVASIGGLSVGEAIAPALRSVFGLAGALAVIAAAVVVVAIWAAVRSQDRTHLDADVTEPDRSVEP